MTAFFLIGLFIIGACFGSFLCCQARRLHLKTKKAEKNLGPRSVCLSCHTKLKWYDNIPIFSWLFLRGKCRKCHQKIGVLEFLSELGVATAFLLIGTTINFPHASIFEWGIFLATLLLTIFLCFLAIYDGMCGELPTVFLILAIFVALILASLKFSSFLNNSSFSLELILKPVFSVLILGGLYLVLYLVSKGKWVGDGDWLLSLALGLALFEPWLAFFTLFLANILACLVMLPMLKKYKRRKIFFGPFMVTAFVIVISLENSLMYIIN